MQKNIASLICLFLCLGTAIPMLSGCRFGGPPYRPSSWEYYSLYSKEYHAPFASKDKSPDYDENALASQFDLPKTDVTSPRGDYLHSSTETRVASNDRSRASASATGHPAFTSEAVDRSTAKPQSVDSLFDQPGTAVAATSNSRQTPQYGSTSPIEQGFVTNNNMGQLTTAASPTMQPMTMQPGQTPFDTGTPLYGQQPNAAQSTFAMGQPTPPVYDPNLQLQGASPANATMNMVPSNTTPQMVASAQGTGGYVGNSPDYTNLLSTVGPVANPATGFPNPTATPMQGVPMQQQPAATPGYQPTMQQPTTTPMQSVPVQQQPTVTPGYQPAMQQPMQQPSMVNPSTTYTYTDPMYGAPYNNNNVMTPQTSATQQPATQQPINGAYQSGFNSYAPTSDTYQPGGVY